MATSITERQAARSVERQRAESAAASARRTVETERAGLAALADALEGPLAEPFARAVDLLHATTQQDPVTGAADGRVVVSGLGKSGHVARKIAATLASTGTPAFFLHPAEAGHGDLGSVGPDGRIAFHGRGDHQVKIRGHRIELPENFYAGEFEKGEPFQTATELREHLARKVKKSVCRAHPDATLFLAVSRRWAWRRSVKKGQLVEKAPSRRRAVAGGRRAGRRPATQARP